MAVWRFVNLNIKEAQLLADLSGIEKDLESTEILCDFLIRALREFQDIHLLDALNTAILIKYTRSFKSGMRSKLPEDLLKHLSSEFLEFHNYCIGLRDKYIAHSVNSEEENQVVAYLVPEETGHKGVSSISVQQKRLVSLGPDDVSKLKEICSELRNRIITLIEVERTKLLELSKKIPIEELYNQEDPPPVHNTMNNVKTPRKPHGN